MTKAKALPGVRLGARESALYRDFRAGWYLYPKGPLESYRELWDWYEWNFAKGKLFSSVAFEVNKYGLKHPEVK